MFKKILQVAIIILVVGFFILVIVGLDSTNQTLGGGVSQITLDPKIATHYKAETQNSKEEYILKIPIHGVILQDSSSALDGFLGEGVTSATAVEEQLQAAALKPNIKAIILDIDSPGGTVVAANYIAKAIKVYKAKTGKKVYSYVSGMAASGGYWVAAATDKIVVAPGALTGSIGVIMGPFKYYKSITEEGGLFGGVVTKDGIENFSFTAGTSKDLLSPYRRMTDAEIAHMQGLVSAEYENFVEHVAKSRHIGADLIRNNIKALIYGNDSAQELGLVDGQMDYVDFLQSLSASKTELDYTVIATSRLSSFLDFFTEKFGGQATKAQNLTSKLNASQKLLPLAYYGDASNL